MEISDVKWSEVKCSEVEWTDMIYVKLFYFKVRWSEWSEWSDWSQVSYGEVLVDKGDFILREFDYIVTVSLGYILHCV